MLASFSTHKYLGESVKSTDGSLNLSLSPGSYQLAASLNSYTSVSENVTVRFSSFTIANVSLAKNSTLPSSWLTIRSVVGVLGSAGIASLLFWVLMRRESL